MENKLKKPNPPALSMQKNSQTVSKTKPKIRIVHIIAPKIIKTDKKNFRELVQRITGKSNVQEKHCKKKKAMTDADGPTSPKLLTQNMDLKKGESSDFERVKEEVEELCSDEFCGGFSVSDFISEEFPLFPFHGTQLMQGFEL